MGRLPDSSSDGMRNDRLPSKAAEYPLALPIFNFLIQSAAGMERSHANPLDPAERHSGRKQPINGYKMHRIIRTASTGVRPHLFRKYSNFRVNRNLTLGNLSIGVAGNSRRSIERSALAAVGVWTFKTAD